MLEKILMFVFGSMLGSFLNVCIYRMPRNESIVAPASHCPACNKPIAWYDNIPLISYILLLGQCRQCKQRISIRYFLVEFLTACLLLFLYMQLGISGKFFMYALIFCGLIIASFVDLEYQIIPDEISVGAVLVGLFINTLFPSLQGFSGFKEGLIFSGLGILVGGGSLYLTGLLGDFIFKKESMGGGDIKLLAGIGAFFGYKIALMVFFMAPLFGAVMGLIVKIRKNISIIPYGPFIALSTFIVVFWGQQILNWLFKY
jgi:leader peptidase (prepilin peptidase)/N-methyltransferase